MWISLCPNKADVLPLQKAEGYVCEDGSVTKAVAELYYI